MNPISMMAWRIGNLLDMAEQVQWTQSHGFTGISLHASAGTPGQWQGLDPATCLPSDRADWRKRLSAFAAREIHAPFAAAITGRDDDAALLALDETLAFAHDLDADIVTIHAEVPTDPPLRQAWRKSTRQLAALARQHHVQVGLEVTSGFDEILDLDEPHLGVTLPWPPSRETSAASSGSWGKSSSTFTSTTLSAQPTTWPPAPDRSIGNASSPPCGRPPIKACSAWN
jgi:sugar phosphate isomerase/epimerase